MRSIRVLFLLGGTRLARDAVEAETARTRRPIIPRDKRNTGLGPLTQFVWAHAGKLGLQIGRYDEGVRCRVALHIFATFFARAIL